LLHSSTPLLARSNIHQLGSISPTPLEQLTYPHALDYGHKPSFQSFIDDVNKGLTRSNGSNKCPYEAVWVLLVRWENDDFKVAGKNNGIQGEIDALETVLVEDYGFHTDVFLIPPRDSLRALQRAIFHFQEEHSKRSELLMVYYGGHGRLDRVGRSIWAE
jgi:hypothetical protein